MKNLGKWLDVEQCSRAGCKRKVKHVIFISTPFEDQWPYVIGACEAHKTELGSDGEPFPHMPIAEFEQKVNKLVERLYPLDDPEVLAHAVANTIDPHLKLEVN